MIKNKKENKCSSSLYDENHDKENIYFIDYSKILSIDNKNKEKIFYYLDKIKKQSDNYFVEKNNENKIKNFYTKFMLKRKKYAQFWEMFFHILLNFCNIYELNHIRYNSNEEVLNNNSDDDLYVHKLINKTENYYFDFKKNNWQEIHKSPQRNDSNISNDSNKNIINLSDRCYSNIPYENKSTNLYYIDGVENHNSKNIINNHQGHKDIILSTNKNIPTKHPNEHIKSYENNVLINNDNNKLSISKNGNYKNTILRKDIQGHNYNSMGKNSKYFFIKNSISNFKCIRKSLYKHKYENKTKDQNKDEMKNKNIHPPEENTQSGKLKRKIIFFENEQNKTKCRKLNNEKQYYNNEYKYNEAKRSTRYINKLMKKKAIFILLNLKRSIERIFDEDEEKQTILLNELYNASTFF